jgi:NADPH:quinone reductase-like Zn-dependent oxidoreductase
MKSLRIIVRRHGGPEVLETIEEEAPEPARGEVRVRVFAAGVSFADLLMREGVHPEKTPLPYTPGWDLVGVVEKIGEEPSQATVGRWLRLCQFMEATPSTSAYHRIFGPVFRRWRGRMATSAARTSSRAN